MLCATGRKELLEKWLKQDKLEASEELGDLVAPLNIKYALKVYRDGKCHDKVVTCLMQLNMLDKVMMYCQQENYKARLIRLILREGALHSCCAAPRRTPAPHCAAPAQRHGAVRRVTGGGPLCCARLAL